MSGYSDQIWYAVVFVLPVLAAGSDASAQVTQFTNYFMLNEPAVQADLKMTNEQIQKCVAYVAGNTTKNEADTRRLKGQENLEKLAAARAANRAELAKQIQSELSADQFSRLTQITLQQFEQGALCDAEIGVSLKLTEAQMLRLKELRKDLPNARKVVELQFAAEKRIEDEGKSREEILAESPARKQKYRERLEEFKLMYLAKTINTLSPDQKTAWEAMKGKPFVDPTKLTNSK